MGDLAESFRGWREGKREEREKIEPQRIKYAIKKLEDAGIEVERDRQDSTKLKVDGIVDFWPYTGWWSGKGVGSGRGLDRLIDKILRKESKDV